MADGDGEPVLVEISEALQALDQVNPLRIAGRVAEVTGLVVRATIPGVRVGEMVTIDVDALPGVPGGQAATRLQAEVVGFRGEEVVLMPLGPVAGIGPDSVVSPTGRSLTIRVGEAACSAVLVNPWTGLAPSPAQPKNGQSTGRPRIPCFASAFAVRSPLACVPSMPF